VRKPPNNYEYIKKIKLYDFISGGCEISLRERTRPTFVENSEQLDSFCTVKQIQKKRV
jgi:hypothetical protein